MSSTPMDLDEAGAASITPTLNITRTLGNASSGGPPQAAVADVIPTFRPTKLFQREDIKDGKPRPHILSIDFDDTGELCMTSEDDGTIQLYNVMHGMHNKALYSKKYGVKLAKFTHANTSIVYASTKQNNAIRYLATHDNSFIRYFEGHEGAVTGLAMHPGADNFLSCSRDNTVHLWQLNSKNALGKLYLNNPSIPAWDPSGQVFAIACPGSATVLLYDWRNWTKAPFGNFDLLEACGLSYRDACFQGWTNLAFSNDGKHLLVGSRFSGHFLLDAFNGSLKAHLRKPLGGTRRLGCGDEEAPGFESSGDCCFTPDGRFVVGGGKKDLLVWDTMATPDEKLVLEPTHVLEEKREAAVVGFNPRFNMLATADEDLMFWLPDPHA